MTPTRAQVVKILDSIPSEEGVLVVDGDTPDLRKLAYRDPMPGAASSMIVIGGPPGDLDWKTKPKQPRKPFRADASAPTDPSPKTPAAPRATEELPVAPPSSSAEEPEAQTLAHPATGPREDSDTSEH